jgi:hypothetical protein
MLQSAKPYTGARFKARWRRAQNSKKLAQRAEYLSPAAEMSSPLLFIRGDFMKLKAALIALLLLGTAARADLKAWPEFKFALASDQKVLSHRSLAAEHNEFEAYKIWQDLKDDRDDLQNEFTHAHRKYQRYLALSKNSTVSKDAFSAAYYDYIDAKNKLSRLPFAIQKARAELEFWREHVIAEGDPDADRRLVLVEAELDARRAETLTMQFDLETATVGLDIAQKKVEDSRELLRKNIISKTDMEDREFLRDDLSDQVESTRNQMETLKLIIEGLEKDLRKLQSASLL